MERLRGFLTLRSYDNLDLVLMPTFALVFFIGTINLESYTKPRYLHSKNYN